MTGVVECWLLIHHLCPWEKGITRELSVFWFASPGATGDFRVLICCLDTFGSLGYLVIPVFGEISCMGTIERLSTPNVRQFDFRNEPASSATKLEPFFSTQVDHVGAEPLITITHVNDSYLCSISSICRSSNRSWSFI